MNDRLLGGFEQLVLLTALHLEREEAYAVPIRAHLEERLERKVSRGALYTALDRLERKGYLLSQMGDPSPVRGGRAKRYYTVSAAGRDALRGTRALLLDLWQGLDSVWGESS